MATYLLTALDQIDEIAQAFLKQFASHRIIAFRGEMGAGKTTFIKALCQQWKVTDVVNSPSFAIVNEYALPGDEKIFHFDFYRLKSESEALDMGYEDYFYSGNYCLIEWPEKIETLMPAQTLNVVLTVLPDGARRIEVQET